MFNALKALYQVNSQVKSKVKENFQRFKVFLPYYHTTDNTSKNVDHLRLLHGFCQLPPEQALADMIEMFLLKHITPNKDITDESVLELTNTISKVFTDLIPNLIENANDIPEEERTQIQTNIAAFQTELPQARASITKQLLQVKQLQQQLQESHKAKSLPLQKLSLIVKITHLSLLVKTTPNTGLNNEGLFRIGSDSDERNTRIDSFNDSGVWEVHPLIDPEDLIGDMFKKFVNDHFQRQVTELVSQEEMKQLLSEAVIDLTTLTVEEKQLLNDTLTSFWSDILAHTNQNSFTKQAISFPLLKSLVDKTH